MHQYQQSVGHGCCRARRQASGRTRFESVGKAVRHETDQADALRSAYLKRLSERREDLHSAAERAGWQLILHRTDESPRKALVQLHSFLGGAR